MRRKVLLAVIVEILLLAGCNGFNKGEEQVENMEKDYNNALEMISETLSCGNEESSGIIDKIRTVGISFPVKINDSSSEEERILCVETETGEKYYVYLDKQLYVYAIEKAETGEFLYRTYQ